MKRNHRSNLLTLLCTTLIACQPAEESQIETYRVSRGEFVVSVTETGELEAVTSTTISAPRIPWSLGGLKIARMVEDGEQVEKGDVLVEFDKTEVQKNLDDAKAALEIALAEVRKAKATQASEIEELESNLKKSELQYRISQLELERSEYKADVDKKKIELDLEKSRISLEKARQEIDNKKTVHKEELSKLELKVKQERAKVEEAEETLGMLTVKAPSPGIVILRKNWSTGNKVQVDEEVWRGQRLLGLPDLSAMQAKAQVNEVDISKIDTTQNALIRMDAFPDSVFEARVRDISVLARNKERDSKVKIFDVTVELLERDSTMMPGMTVGCEIIVDRIQDALFIPLDALFKHEGQSVVYRKHGSGFKAQPVKTGSENDNYVVITEGLAEGDEVALFDPTKPMVALEVSSTEK